MSLDGTLQFLGVVALKVPVEELQRNEATTRRASKGHYPEREGLTQHALTLEMVIISAIMLCEM